MNFFTYSSSEKLDLGDLVGVSLRNKSYKAVVWSEVNKPKFKCKDIEFVELKFCLSEWQMKMVEYLSKFYFANISTCLGLFLPKKITGKRYDWAFEEESLENFDLKSDHKLNIEQQGILDDLLLNRSEISLLHGITGSGKTEIYLQLIMNLLNKDSSNQILLLVPEISLTPQVTNYFKKYLKDENISIYHSKLNVSEKFKEWKKVKSGQSKLVIGSRSSLFLPFQNLAQIIVDEEHDYAYKQEQDPKYHVRNLTQWLNKNLKTAVLYGSATPSLEVYYAAKVLGRIKYYYLGNKAKAEHALEYKVVDMRDEKKAGNFHFISNYLYEEIKQTLRDKNQVLLLHNRRGSGSFLQCLDCGNIKECPNCSISLTPHRKNLQCHYCMFQDEIPLNCKMCGGSNMKTVGIGVKKIEDELNDLFPDSNIVRVDSDTNSKKDAHAENYEIIKSGEADIIVGTQIIATGIDVENISLVGVINVDQHLNFPDFRAHERTFQLLTQFAGRAGRGKHKGKVVLQTYQPENEVVVSVKNEEGLRFIENEIKFREGFSYPPFTKLVKLTFSNKLKSVVEKEVSIVEQKLRAAKFFQFKSGVPLIEKKHNKYYHQILLDCLNPEPVLKFLDLGTGWSVDRDPMSTI